MQPMSSLSFNYYNLRYDTLTQHTHTVYLIKTVKVKEYTEPRRQQSYAEMKSTLDFSNTYPLGYLHKMTLYSDEELDSFNCDLGAIVAIEVRLGDSSGTKGIECISGVTRDFGAPVEDSTDAVGDLALAYEVPEDGPESDASTAGTIISCTIASSISRGDISGGDIEGVAEGGVEAD
jgi:hypothetical protein